ISYKELFFYALFGILLGIFAAGFIKFFIMIEDSFSRIRLPQRVKPILGGFVFGIIGIFFPYILGNGYEHAERALLGELSLWIVIGLIILKPVATSITIGSGWSGGIFAPTIFIGAVAGNAFGNLVEIIFSSPVELSSSYATVGMGTFLAAVTQAPLTSIFLIFELTQSYEVVIPIMITSVLGWVVTRLIVGGSLEAIELKRAGVDIEEGMEENIFRSIRVGDVMSRNVETIPDNMPLRKLTEYIPNSTYTTFPLVDDKGLLSGIISIRDFRELIYEESLKDLVVVKELATLNVLTVNEDDTLDMVLKKWGMKPVGIIPVVESSQSRKIVGVISSKDVIRAYNKSLTEKANEKKG
ncbi:MAG: chloride channel protein, partial [Thermodesulfobacteriota bacterium]